MCNYFTNMKLHCYLKVLWQWQLCPVVCQLPTHRQNTSQNCMTYTSGFKSNIYSCPHAQQNHLNGIFSQQPQFVNLPLHIALCFHVNIRDWQWSLRGWLPVTKATDGQQTECTNQSGVPRKIVRVFTSIDAVPLSHKHTKIYKCSYFKEMITHKCKMCHLLVW